MSNFIEGYKNLIKKKPYLESVFTISGVCIFAFLTAYICKVYSTEDVKDTNLVLNEEERNYYEGNYDEAIKELKKKEEKEDWPISLMKQSKIQAVKGDILESNSLAEKAYIQSRISLDENRKLKNKEEVAKLLNDISFTYIMNGEVSRGIEFGELLLDEYSDNENLKKTLATAYLANGEYEKAIEILNSIDINKKDSYELSELGELYLISGDYKRAIELLKIAYKEDNTNVNILAILKEHSENKNLRDFLEENEKDSINNIFLAQINLYDEKLHDDSIIRINKIEDESLLKKVLELQVSEKDSDEGRSSILLKEIEEEYNETYGGAYVLSRMNIKNGNIEDGIHYGNKTIEFNENFGKAYGVLFSEALKNSDNIADSIGTYLREGLEKSPYSVQLIKEIANYYKEKGELLISYNYYKIASKLEPYNASNHINKSILEANLEDVSVAKNTIEDAINIDKENSDLYNFLGVIYLETENSEEAIKNIRKAYELNNDNIKALNNAAVYYTRYEKNIFRAKENIDSAKDMINDNVELKLKETILKNQSLINKTYEEVQNSDSDNFEIENLELLI
ncbi:hypothetical protein HMPREF1092_00658 [Clostridium thermobutyricum]|uniref:Tetratricopeptide repeat-like domain-containing protein n=1 Tax=Clostridium thermobutyricum TaxID=29372 RepID=N9WK18_9CLOT|nr:tetratricopeptide repeat protein [Clostridium thermobutyricum]ENZ03471.1 hypothetical protein HMPREF1092_00658 [Clostridium thermobutyricum]